MPGLYGITSNANISVYNTTGLYNVGNTNVAIKGNVTVSNTLGLYQGLGNPIILTNAQQLYTLLDETGNVQFALTNSNTTVKAFTANINTPTGTYGSGVTVPVITTGADGRVTNISQTLITGYVGQYSNANVAAYLPVNSANVAAPFFLGNGKFLTGLPASSITLTGDVTGTGNTGTPFTTTLSATGVVPGTYGDDITVPQITIDAKGRITTVANVVIAGGGTGRYGNANVAAFLPTYGGTINAFTVFNASGLAVQGADYAQLQWTNGRTPPQSEYDVGIGSWIYVDAGGGVFQSNSTGTLRTILLGNDGNLTVGNSIITTNGVFWANGEIYGGTYSNANVSAYLPYYTGTLANSSTITGIQANLGAFQTYTNSAISSTNANVSAANAAISTLQTQVYSNANVAAYLPINSANVGGQFFLGNAFYMTGVGQITYSNANVTAFLPLYTGTLSNSSTITAMQSNISILQSNIGAISNVTVINATNGNYPVLVSNASTYVRWTIDAQGAVNSSNGAIQNAYGITNLVVGNGFTVGGNVVSIATNTPSSGNYRLTFDVSKTIYPWFNAEIGGPGSFQYTGWYANAQIQGWVSNAVLQTFQINSLQANSNSYGNANVAAFLTTNTGNITANNITATGNITSDNLSANSSVYSTNGYFWSNGTPYTTTSGDIGIIQANAFAANGMITQNYWNIAEIQNDIYQTIGNVGYVTSDIPTFVSANVNYYRYTIPFTSNGVYTLSANEITNLTVGNGYAINGQVISVTGSGPTYQLGFIVNRGFYPWFTVGSGGPTQFLGGANKYANTVISGRFFSSNINALSANLGAYQTYTNSAISSINSNVSTINANVSAANAQIQTISANLGAYQTWANGQITSLTSNAASQQTQINTINANVTAANLAIANLAANSNTYSNANVASYLPVYGGNVQLSNIIGVSGQTIGIRPANNGNVYISGNVLQFGGENAFTTLTANGNIIISPVGGGYGSGLTFIKGIIYQTGPGGVNFDSQVILGQGLTAGNGQISANRLLSDTYINAYGNISALGAGNYFIGDGSQLTNINAGNIVGSYGNANVAAYLPTDPTITAIQANVSAANASIQTISANLGAYQTYANGAISSINANVAAANARIITLESNVGAFENYANITFTTNANARLALSVVSNNGGYSDSSLTYSNATGVFTYTGPTWVTHATTIRIPVKNTSGGSLAVGTPVYATGTVGATEVIEVSPSRADTPSTMPVIGLLESALGVNAVGYMVQIGFLANQNTSAYAVGDELYVAAAGGLTNVRPADGNAVQFLGTVVRAQNNTGIISVDIWDQNGLPNLGQGNIWVGPNAGGLPQQVSFQSYLAANTVITAIQANVTAANSSIATLNANVGAFQTYTNNTFQTFSANSGAYQTWANGAISSINANLGAYQIYANGAISSINANLGAYQIYANGAISSINANLGAFQTYTNSTFQTFSANSGAYQTWANGYFASGSALQTLDANVGAYEIWANGRISTIDANIGSYQTWANGYFASGSSLQTLDANVGAYEIWANGAISSVNANVVAANSSIQTISANLGSYQTWANGYFVSSTAFNVLDANVGAYETWANASFAQLSSSPTFVGNVTAPYFLGNGYFLTGIVAGSTYSNANVAAYLPTYTGTLNNSSTIIGIQGNLGAYQVWANGYFASGSSLQTLDANVGAYEIWANGRITTLDANLGTATNNINSINANVTAANAQIQTISANLGAFQTYTNSQFQTFSANSGAFQTYTNSQFQTFSANSGAFQTYANSTFYKSGSSITVANVVTTAGVFWSNGVAYSTGSTYGNTQVAAFLPIYGGNISAANMYATSANITGLVSFGSSYKETVTALGNQTGTLTINVAAGTIQTMTLTGNVTMNTNNLTNFGPGQSVTLIMTQDGSGSRLLTSNLLYAGNVKTLSTTASATDTVNVLYDGSKYLAVIVKGYI